MARNPRRAGPAGLLSTRPSVSSPSRPQGALRIVRLARVLALAVAAVAAALPATAQAASFTSSELTLRAPDGVALRGTIDVPRGPVVPPHGYPAIVLLHGWGGDR